MPDDLWRYKKDGVEAGPVSESELQNMLRTGALPEDTPVYADYLGAWTTASQVASLAAGLISPAALEVGSTIETVYGAEMEDGEKSAIAVAEAPEPLSTSNSISPSSAAESSQAAASVPVIAADRAGQSIMPAPQIVEPRPPSPSSVRSTSTGGATPQAAAARALAAAQADAVNIPATASAAKAVVDLSDPLLHPHPFHRLFARIIDTNYATFAAIALFAVFAFLIGTLMGAMRLPDELGGLIALPFLCASLLFYCLLEPVMLSMGTTLGKALFNIRVRNQDGSTLRFGQAFMRTLLVFLAGGGLVSLIPIPFLNCIAQWGFMVFHFLKLNENGITLWDRDGGYRYEHHPVGFFRMACAVMILLLPYLAVCAFIVYSIVTYKPTSD